MPNRKGHDSTPRAKAKDRAPSQDPRPRRPWISAHQITILVREARTQHHTHPTEHLSPDEQYEAREAWLMIVQDSLRAFCDQMRCQKCGGFCGASKVGELDGRGDFIRKWGLKLWLEELGVEMEGCDVEALTDDRVGQWDDLLWDVVYSITCTRDGECVAKAESEAAEQARIQRDARREQEDASRRALAAKKKVEESQLADLQQFARVGSPPGGYANYLRSLNGADKEVSDEEPWSVLSENRKKMAEKAAKREEGAGALISIEKDDEESSSPQKVDKCKVDDDDDSTEEGVKPAVTPSPNTATASYQVGEDGSLIIEDYDTPLRPSCPSVDPYPSDEEIISLIPRTPDTDDSYLSTPTPPRGRKRKRAGEPESEPDTSVKPKKLKDDSATADKKPSTSESGELEAGGQGSGVSLIDELLEESDGDDGRLSGAPKDDVDKESVGDFSSLFGDENENTGVEDGSGGADVKDGSSLFGDDGEAVDSEASEYPALGAPKDDVDTESVGGFSSLFGDENENTGVEDGNGGADVKDGSSLFGNDGEAVDSEASEYPALGAPKNDVDTESVGGFSSLFGDENENTGVEDRSFSVEISALLTTTEDDGDEERFEDTSSMFADDEYESSDEEDNEGSENNLSDAGDEGPVGRRMRDGNAEIQDDNSEDRDAFFGDDREGGFVEEQAREQSSSEESEEL